MSDVKFGLVHDFFGTGSGTHDHTDSNFGGGTPKGALLVKCYGTALNTVVNHLNMTFGAAESATQGALFIFSLISEHGQASTDCFRKSMDTQCSWIGDPTNGERDGWTDFSSFAANKVTWDVNNTYNSDYGTYSVLFGGSDLNVQVGVFDPAAEDSEATITTGFDMTNGALIFFGSDSAFSSSTGMDSTGSRIIFGFGSYDGTTFRQASYSHQENDGKSTGFPYSRLDDSKIMNRIDGDDGSVVWTLEWTAADSTTFGITTRDGTFVGEVGYIALGLPSDWNATVTVEDLPTSVSNPTTFSPAGGTGWTPQILFQILTLMEAVDTSLQNNTAGGVGLRTVIGTASDDEYCMAGNVEDASATTDTECGIHDSGFLNEDDGTTGFEMDLNAFISGGWKDDFVNVMGTAKKTICLAMGEDDDNTSHVAALADSFDNVVQRRRTKITSF